MIARIRQLFLSPRGRINRAQFGAGLAAWMAFYAVQIVWFSQTGAHQFNFILALVLLFLNLHIIVSLYGKRLHDFGRTTWPVIGMFVLVMISAILVMLNFGGLEYFETLNQNPEIAQDPVAMQQVHQVYQESLAQNLPRTRLILSIIPVVFTLWVALKPGQSAPNKYGEVPGPFKS